jgi:hypothetical protein
MIFVVVGVVVRQICFACPSVQNAVSPGSFLSTPRSEYTGCFTYSCHNFRRLLLSEYFPDHWIGYGGGSPAELATVITGRQPSLTSMYGDIQEDLARCIVDVATNVNDLHTLRCIMHYCEMGKNVYHS